MESWHLILKKWQSKNHNFKIKIEPQLLIIESKIL